MDRWLTIGAVAAATGESRDTIRYYERIGLVPRAARTDAGYRRYRDGIIRRLGLIRNAQRFGFSLKEIAGFLGVRDGGAIEVDARAAGNPSVRDAVRSHLREIAQSFADGDFAKPFATHGEVPPGVAEMTRLKASISYLFEETEHGGRVRIRTSTTAARDAVHAFLRYQIREHATGDPLTVKVPS